MELTRLLKTIDEAIEDCQNGYKKDPDLVDIKNALGKHTSFTPSNIASLDPDLLFIVCANFLSETSTYDTVRLFYNYDPNYFKNNDFQRVGMIFKLAESVNEYIRQQADKKIEPGKEYDEIKFLFDDKEIRKQYDGEDAKRLYSEIDAIRELKKDEFDIVLKFIREEGVDTDTLVKILLISLLPINNNLKRRAEEQYKDLLSKAGDIPALSKAQDRKYLDRLHQGCVEMFCNKHQLTGFLKALNAYMGVLEEADIKETKLRKEKTNKYKMLKSQLSYTPSTEITNVDELVSLCESEKLKKDIAEYIYSHNSKCNDSLRQEYEELSEDKKLPYLMLLDSIGIVPTKEELDVLMQKDITDVEHIFSKLQSVNFSKDKYITIAAMYDEQLFDKLSPMLEENTISSDFVCSYFEELKASNDKLNILFSNIETLKTNGISSAVIATSNDILLTDNSTIANNIRILKTYKLLSSIKEGTRLNFLESSDLTTKIDIILESGFEEYLEDSINLLNRSNNDWKRVSLFLSLGIKITSLEELNKVLDSSSSIISDPEVNNYFDTESRVLSGSNSDSKVKLPAILSKFDYTERTYLIGNKIVSKERVKRNYQKAAFLDKFEDGRALLTSIIEGSIYNENDYYNISVQLKKAK